MIHHLLRVGVLLTFAKLSLQSVAVSSPSYVGAVVEYHPVTDGDDGQMIAVANVNNYETIIKSASTYNVDIIVFPEFGLTSLPKNGDRERQFNETTYRAFYRDTASYIPSPNETVILCDTDSKYAKSLKSISCAAREYKMYVVVNHHERVDCPEPKNCSSDGFLLYNTNVVFDRKGRVVARYRKFNLFNEPGTNVTGQPEISVFTTDFGVTFGQFICFDLWNEKPATFFAKNPNVTDIVYSTHWFDALPFLAAVEIQAAWSYAADVNFLAAGYSDALTDSGGSGIYAGKSGPIQIYYPRLTSNALVVAEIPKLNRRNHVEDVRAGKSAVHVFKQAEVPTVTGTPLLPRNLNSTRFRESLKAYTTRLIDPSEGSHITTLCDRGLCCDFHVETSYDKELAAKPDAKQYRYRLAVFNGVWSAMDVKTAGLEVCALVACTGDSVDDCGQLYPEKTNVVAPTSFDSLIITRRANLAERVMYMPSTITRELEPFGSGDFAYLASGQRNSSLLLMYLVRPTTNLVTFGIYGRRFDRDGEPETKVPSTAASIEVTLLAVLVLHVVAWMKLC